MESMYSPWIDHQYKPPPTRPLKASKKDKSVKSGGSVKSSSTTSLFSRLKRQTKSEYEDDRQTPDIPYEDMEACGDDLKQHESEQEVSEGAARPQSSDCSHRRGESFHVKFTEKDVKRLAGEIYNGTIADVNMSLLTFYILEEHTNYELAKHYIRELGVDQGYNVDRESNVHLRKLMRETISMRPKETKPPVAIVSSTPTIRSMASHAEFGNKLPREFFANFARRPSGRGEKAPAAAQSAIAESITPPKEYPPNTPDRPAPLSVRSRNAIVTPPTAFRSVSSPVASRPNGSDDVFGRASEDATTLHSIGIGESAYGQVVEHVSPDSTASSNTVQAPSGVQNANDDDFETVQSDAKSTNSSVLESASSESIQETGTQYSFAAASLRSATEQLGSQATPRPLEPVPMAHRRSRINTANPISSAPTFHQPLPLRAYENEGYRFPAARPGSAFEHHRTNSSSSMLRGNRSSVSFEIGRGPRLTAMQLARLPVRSSSTRAISARAMLQDQNGSIHVQDDQSSVIEQSISGSQATTLISSFPMPPTNNPVSVIPMNAMNASAQLSRLSTVGQLLEAYRKVYSDLKDIRSLLDQTRADGEMLGKFDWAALPPFERAWREMNKPFLESVYGSANTFLTPEDVEYVEQIARDLKDSGYAQVLLDAFEDDDEQMF
ncbi:hypothetical protein EK21DRAFT_86616 [Setomelanomma holmii]|uniref:Uncharacterized protein n=1 Tax=Setomelanomma holmii TaxID=210430 RepID=A0A9P4HES9_9PLEO|nr:hypothetical protein EK21DRAFT_86616 [Setomelanomma holmii]